MKKNNLSCLHIQHVLPWFVTVLDNGDTDAIFTNVIKLAHNVV